MDRIINAFTQPRDTPGLSTALGFAQRIEVLQGDLTELAVDAIVNAADRSLLGGGVDGAIHSRGAKQGPSLCLAFGARRSTPIPPPRTTVRCPSLGLPP